MAGSNPFTKNSQKGKNYNSIFNNTEVLNDSHAPIRKNNLFSGILEPGKSIDFSGENNQRTEKVRFDNHLQNEQAIFINQHQEEIKKEIDELLTEIKKLAKSTDDLEQTIELAADQPVVEFNTYELNFLSRIKKLIVQFRLNVSQASNCLEMFQSRKKKKNAFWNKAKSGGTKYTDSGEHSVARSAN
jgi:hypothetical protein